SRRQPFFSGSEKRFLASLYATRYIDLRSMHQSPIHPSSRRHASRFKRPPYEATLLVHLPQQSWLSSAALLSRMAQAVDFNQHIFVTSTPTLDGSTARARFCQVVRLEWGSSSPTDGHLDARRTQIDFHRLHERPQWIVCNRLGGPASC